MSGSQEREAYRHLSGADARFKADGRSRLVWSILAATALHYFIFFGTPNWITPTVFRQKIFQPAEEWVYVYLPSLGANQVEEPQWEGDGLAGEVDTGTEAGADAGGQAAAEILTADDDVLREVLLSRALVPSLAQPTSVPTSLEQPAQGEGSLHLEGGGAAAVDLADLAAADSLALELLTSLRPELVVLNPSTWILIRNPSVVESFMRQRASALPDLSGGRRSTSVALWIDETGSVEWAEVSQSSGRTDLDELALELFSEVATFRPARDRGVRVPTTAIFTVHFPW
jgi:TonB family protein